MRDVVKGYYDRMADTEWARLDNAYRRFEWVSTLRLIDEHFPTDGRVADIGGGPGKYTIELLRRGYRVSLVDLSEKAIELAHETLDRLGLSCEHVACADATDLGFLESGAFDAALLLGPMYHLVSADDRADALSELRRILRPGAPAIIAFINPWGILRSGLAEFRDLYADADRVRALLDTCVQAGEQRAFTEAAFLTPPQALAEIRRAGFAVEARAGVEGFASGMLDETERLSKEDPLAYENVLRLVAKTCLHPAYRDCTEHLHVVARCLDRRR